MNEDEPRQTGTAKQLRFKNNATVADKARGVNRYTSMRRLGQEASTISRELRQDRDANRTTGDVRQPDLDIDSNRCQATIAREA